jgi:hypothetical protein
MVEDKLRVVKKDIISIMASMRGINVWPSLLAASPNDTDNAD